MYYNKDYNQKPNKPATQSDKFKAQINEPVEIDKLNYVKTAEKVIKQLKKGGKVITTNQIRKVLTLINELYSMAKREPTDTINEDLQSHVQYIKMKLMYEAGREETVKIFLEKSSLTDKLDEVGKSKEDLILICNYTEALVAYHKYHINK